MNLNTPSKRIGALLLVLALIMAVTYVLQWEYYDSRPRPAYSEFPDFAPQFQTSQEDDPLYALAQSIADESKYERMLDSFLGGVFIYWFVRGLRRWVTACDWRTVSFDWMGAPRVRIA